MFASLLAASRASNLGLVGCTLTDADMNAAGLACPNGSNPTFAVVSTGTDEERASGWGLGLSRGSCDVEGGAGLCVTGDVGGLMNIDFVPSISRPPRGGSFMDNVARVEAARGLNELIVGGVNAAAVAVVGTNELAVGESGFEGWAKEF